MFDFKLTLTDNLEGGAPEIPSKNCFVTKPKATHDSSIVTPD